MLWWLLVFSALGLGAWGDSSWDETQAKHLSEGLQDLSGNISQLAEKGQRGLNGVSAVVSRKRRAADSVGCRAQLALPVNFLVTHHIPRLECHDQTECRQRLRELQAHHVRNGWCDVAYNFLVGDDGRVYKGVGWNVQGMHTQGYNNISLGLAFFGTKEGHSPSPAALAAMEALISSAVRKGHLSPLYVQPLLVKGESCLAPQQEASLKEACPFIVPRSAWEPRGTHCPKMNLPAKYVIISHTMGRTCSKSDECLVLVQDIQSYWMDKLGSCDTGYNFLVGQDGVIYEGVGWSVQGSHTPDYNDIALGVAFMGIFSSTPPNAAALEAAQNLIQCSVAKGHLASNYLLVGHSDVSNVLSPGRALYNIIKTWPHFRH
ncbi:peptidoglycan recognition protein 4-like [Hippopotamus amphibius kiboko]|uniref:peptidoglycan recognition protein 4-like n=1 Tax=Hippopotamus amphibius kiboko TaxID=575201 RepID=UPI002593EA0F|nr:peptidoglycan recognition protein 4-like [Hippopotamus amphibius kiboko]XP_057580595.1 peptidoglycan recognition protein 4-like [Hippopotamus amphibius kiboko]